jgi:hypothetical protein
MFGRTYIDNSFRGPSHVTVTENRAPTDKSIELLKEMEKAARKKVIDTIVVADTSFECKIHKTIDAMSLQDVYCVVYKMNGFQRDLQIRVDLHEKLGVIETAERIRDKVAYDIATHMIGRAIQESFR